MLLLCLDFSFSFIFYILFFKHHRYKYIYLIYRNLHTPVHGTTSRLSRSATHSTGGDVPDIVEVDEEGDIENDDGKFDIDNELIQGDASPNLIKKDELLSPNKEV